jgi:hypothetical protein
MSIDHAIRHGIIGGPTQKPVERCPVTNRIYESGSGALDHAHQTALFIREAAIIADMPKEGEVCAQTGRPYEVSAQGGSPRWDETKTAQSQRFLEEAPPEFKAKRQADFVAFQALEPLGRA